MMLKIKKALNQLTKTPPLKLNFSHRFTLYFADIPIHDNNFPRNLKAACSFPQFAKSSGILQGGQGNIFEFFHNIRQLFSYQCLFLFRKSEYQNPLCFFQRDTVAR